MKTQFRIKLGRLAAGVRTWEDPLTIFAITDVLEYALTHQFNRRQIADEDYSDVTPPAILRRDNISLPLTAVVSEENLRALQSYALWCADFEPITHYYTVYTGRGAYVDVSTSAMHLGMTTTPPNPTDSIFIGLDTPFIDIDFLHSTFGIGCTFNVYYWDGAAWQAVAGLVDNTTLFTTDGNISFTLPTDWEKTTEGGNLPNKYWIEIDFTAAATRPIWVYIRPTVPVVVLLYRSDDSGVTWPIYSENGYYPNLWDIENLQVLFQTGGLATRVVMRLLEGY